MPYEIWRSLVAQQKLANLEIVEPEIARQIDEMLNRLAIDRESFITGEPQKMESFVVSSRGDEQLESHREEGVLVT